MADMLELPDSGWRNLVLDALCLCWPDVFRRRGQRPVMPLSVGIRSALCSAVNVHRIAELTGMSAKALKEKAVNAALCRYTDTTWYLAAVAAGGARYSLDGQAAGEITAHARKGAKAALKARARANRKAASGMIS